MLTKKLPRKLIAAVRALAERDAVIQVLCETLRRVEARRPGILTAGDWAVLGEAERRIEWPE